MTQPSLFMSADTDHAAAQGLAPPPESSGADPFSSLPFAKPLAPHRAKKNEPVYGLLIPKPEDKTDLQQELEKEIEEENNKKEQEKKDAEEETSKPQAAGEIPSLYKAPFWSGKPKFKYTLELVQNGVSKGRKPVFKKGWYLFGRAPICDIILDHPSVSRQHAVIQYKKAGEAFLYDLGSTHGTFIGKNRLKPNEYVPIIEGNNMIKFGTSSRYYILENNENREVDSDDDEEGEGTKGGGEGDLKKLFQSLPKEQPLESKKKKKKKKSTEGDEMADELDEEDEDLALLDQHKEFFEEYYEGDDDDEFFDRTGKVTEKKKKEDEERDKAVTETYDTLAAKERVLREQRDHLQKEVDILAKEKTDLEGTAIGEEIDSYMRDLNLSLVKEKLLKKTKLLQELNGEHAKMAKMASIAKPALQSLSDHTNITPEQILRVNQFEASIRRRKLETDAKESETAEERARKLKQQMSEIGQARKDERARRNLMEKGTAKPLSAVSVSGVKNLKIEDYKPSFIPGVTEPIQNAAPASESPANPDAKPEKTHTVSLLAGLVPEKPKTKKRKLEGDDELEYDEEVQDEEKEGEEKPKEAGEENGEEVDSDDMETDEAAAPKFYQGPALPDVPKKKGKKNKKPRFDEEVEGAYETWAPPPGQSGDGRSYLNEKFGY